MDLRSGVAFWPLRNGLIRAYPALDRDERADVAIIGAGITGALVAHHLTAAGASVVVLDRRDVASGSTAATTGLLQYETDTTLAELADSVGEAAGIRAYRRGLEAIDTIERLTRDLGESCGFARRPSVMVASSRRDARRLQDECEARARHGFAVAWLTPEELAATYGIEAHGALRSEGNAQIDAHRFAHALLTHARRGGARVYDRTSVERVTTGADHVELTTDRGPTVHARRIVWAAGYESVEETQRRVGSLHSTWAFVSEPVADLGPWHDQALLWETARPYLYARVTDDGRILVGGEDEPFRRSHASTRRLARKTRRLVDRFGRWFPSIAFEVAYAWSGVFGTTKDGLPYIGTTPEHPHAWLALGYGGNGITFSTIAADLILADWRGTPDPDAHIFAFDRHTRGG